jgi:hypothetical protein
MSAIVRRGFLILVTLVLLAKLASADNKKLVVVVAKSSSVTNVSRFDLKRSFLGEAITVGNVRLAPFNAEINSDERAGFDLGVLGMTADQVGRFWVDRKVRGQGAAPRSLPAVHLPKVVAKFPGAIGYLRVDQLTPDVKAVKVDGVPYTDPRYSIVTR